MHVVAAALEMAWHPYFNPGTANTRMDYEHPLNRPLFIALFKQTQASSNALSDCRRSVSATLLIAERRCPLCSRSLAWVLSQMTNGSRHTSVHTQCKTCSCFTLSQMHKCTKKNYKPLCTGQAEYVTVQQQRIKTATVRHHELLQVLMQFQVMFSCFAFWMV